MWPIATQTLIDCLRGQRGWHAAHRRRRERDCTCPRRRSRSRAAHVARVGPHHCRRVRRASSRRCDETDAQPWQVRATASPAGRLTGDVILTGRRGSGAFCDSWQVPGHHAVAFDGAAGCALVTGSKRGTIPDLGRGRLVTGSHTRRTRFARITRRLRCHLTGFSFSRRASTTTCVCGIVRAGTRTHLPLARDPRKQRCV